MSDVFTAVPEGKVYSEADVTKLMEVQGVERDAAIGTLEMWSNGQGQWTEDYAFMFPAVIEAWKSKQAPVEPVVEAVAVEPVMGESPAPEAQM